MDLPIPIVIDPTSAATKAFQSPLAAATSTDPESTADPSLPVFESFIMHDHVIHTKPEIHLFPIDEIYPWITGDTVKLNANGIPQHRASDEVQIVDVTPAVIKSTNAEKLAKFANEWKSASVHVAKLAEIAEDAAKTVHETTDWKVKSKLAMDMLKVGGQLGSFSQVLTESGTQCIKVIEEEKKKSAERASFKVPKAPKKSETSTLRPPMPKIVRPRMWQCHKCSKFYPSKQEMDKCCQADVVTSFKCNICQAVFNTQQELNTHKAAHMEGPYMCQVCGKLYRELSQKQACVQKHFVRVEQSSTATAKSYTCDQCGKVYTRREAFKNHMDAHAGLRKYVCPICGKGFANSQTKRVHVFKVHKPPAGKK